MGPGCLLGVLAVPGCLFSLPIASLRSEVLSSCVRKCAKHEVSVMQKVAGDVPKCARVPTKNVIFVLLYLIPSYGLGHATSTKLVRVALALRSVWLALVKVP